jgi:ribonuclease Z
VALEMLNSEGEPIKITYSGDTMPCDELITLGQDSTVLIHEATMEDELIEEAAFKMHSTISQAIEQGAKMNAQFTLLTHFSQRYAKLPRLNEDLNKNIGIAFDNMEVSLNVN